MNQEDDESKANIDKEEVWCWNHDDKHKEGEECEEEHNMEDKYDENFEEKWYEVNSYGESYEMEERDARWKGEG